MLENSPSLLSTRESLLSRIKDWEDAESWRDFFNIYSKLIYGTALRAGLRETEAQEVLQETIIAVAKKMPSFQYDPTLSSFKGWLLQLTRWKITDQFRKRRPEEARPQHSDPDSTRTATVERIPDPAFERLDAGWEEDWRRTIFEGALERVKRRANPKHYQIFDLHVNKHWPPEKVAQTLGLNVGQVYLAKHKITILMKQEIKRLETQLV